MSKFNEVVLIAGTHGNELSGLYIHKLIREKLLPAQRESFEVTPLVANPEAVKRNVRFVDTDLNRLFTSSPVTTDTNAHEVKVAEGLKQQLANKKGQLIVDLHNTTSKMGATLILLSRSSYYERMGAYIKQRMPEANIVFEPEKSWDQQPYLCTVGDAGVIIEVEEQSHSVLTLNSLDLMKKMLMALLDFVEIENQGQQINLSNYEAFSFTEEIAFPLDEDGMRLATVHPTISGKDFCPVHPGQPILSGFSGFDYCWTGDKTVYPHFINEAAYSMQHIAMAMAEKIYVSV